MSIQADRRVTVTSLTVPPVMGHRALAGGSGPLACSCPVGQLALGRKLDVPDRDRSQVPWARNHGPFV